MPLRAAEEGAISSFRAPAGLFSRGEGIEGTRTALVIEDDTKSAGLIRVQLEAQGFKVLHAASAEAALALVAQEPVSLITLDILLPHMDGWEFLTRLKQVPDLRSVPVLIISIVADTAKGFEILPRRWVVERTFAWLNRNRRLAKDFETTIESSVAWLQPPPVLAQ